MTIWLIGYVVTLGVVFAEDSSYNFEWSDILPYLLIMMCLFFGWPFVLGMFLSEIKSAILRGKP